MGKFDALAEALGLAVKKYGDDAAKILEKVDTPELATSLKGTERGQYLKALDEVYGPQANRAKQMGFGKRTWYHGTTVPVDKFKKDALGLSTNAQSAKKGFFFAEDPSTASDYAELAREKGVIREGDKVTTRVLSETAELHNEAYDKIRDLAFERDIRLGNIQKQIDRNYNTKEVIKIAKEKGQSDRLADLNKKLAQGEELINKWRNEAESFGKEIKSIDDQIGSQGQNVLPVRLKGSPENIHVKNYKGQGYRDTTYADEMAKAQAQGKTGILFKNTFDPADPANRVQQDIAAVFEPNQIRSEFAAFDPRFKDSPLLMAGALAAPMGQMDVSEQMNPLKVAQPYVEAYEEKKKQLTDALARQLNIAGAAPEIEKPVSQTLSMVGDPLNYVPGGEAIGLLQAGAGLSPKSAQMEALEQAKIKSRVGR